MILIATCLIILVCFKGKVLDGDVSLHNCQAIANQAFEQHTAPAGCNETKQERLASVQ